MNGVPCLQLVDVAKNYGGLRVFSDVNLTIQQGERRGIIGPNGAGKTTLFQIISGQVAPSAGRVLLRGNDITRLPPYRRATMGMARVFQVTTLFPNLTALQNLILAVQGVKSVKYAALRPVNQCKAIVDQAQAFLGRIGLSGRENRLVRALSYGEQRQLEIGMALASDPHLLLLDEPTAGLARAEVTRMIDLLQSLPKDMTIVFIEHDMTVAFALSDTLTVLAQGRIIADGAQAEIRGNPAVREAYLGGT
jgi:branched-chain amino acid transport system ATP-binding protein